MVKVQNVKYSLDWTKKMALRTIVPFQQNTTLNAYDLMSRLL